MNNKLICNFYNESKVYIISRLDLRIKRATCTAVYVRCDLESK